MSKRRRPPRDPLAALTLKQLRMQADSLLGNSLTGPRQSIARAQQEARAQATQDAQMIQGFTTALAGIVGNQSQSAGQAYSQAADQQQRIAQGYAIGQHLAEQGATDQGNALLASQGQTRRLATGSGSGTTYQLGSGPASVMSQAGLSANTIAHGLPAYEGGLGQQLQASRLNQGEADQAKLRAQLEDLMNKVPGLRADIMDRLYQRELSKSAARTQAAYLGVSQYNAATQRYSAVTGANNDAAAAAAAGNKAANKQVLAARKARNSALASARDDSFRYADKLFKGTPSGPGLPNVKPTWEQAYGKIWTRYGQPLMRYAPPGQRSWWKGQLNAYIVNAMKTAGFTKARGTNRG